MLKKRHWCHTAKNTQETALVEIKDVQERPTYTEKKMPQGTIEIVVYKSEVYIVL